MNRKRHFVTSILFLVLFRLTLVQGLQEDAAAAEAPSYLIGPNDVLSVHVWKEPELTREVKVMADGRISFPLVGEAMAQGKTVTELKNDIAKALRKYITAPEVAVIVESSLSRRIYTIGKLFRPGPYPLEAGMSVIQALSSAGGFTEWADTKNIRIVRREGDREVQLRFNYNEFISGTNTQQNILLRPGDTIVVP